MSKSEESLEKYMPNEMHFRDTVTDIKKIMPILLGNKSKKSLGTQKIKVNNSLKSYLKKSTHCLIENSYFEAVKADVQEFITKKSQGAIKTDDSTYTAESGRVYGWHSDADVEVSVLSVFTPSAVKVLHR